MKSIFKKMIENSRNKACIISFGLGLTTYNCSVGDEVPVYVSGAFNQNEFVLNQNETNDLMVNYFYEDATIPTIINSQTPAIFAGMLNNKPKYHLTIEGIDLMLWYNINTPSAVPPFPEPEFHNNRWVLTQRLTTIPSNINPKCSIDENSFLPPVNKTFQMNSTLFININITNINIITTNCRFSFDAVTTKEIQVEMQNKNGTILKSNKINLIVTP